MKKKIIDFLKKYKVHIFYLTLFLVLIFLIFKNFSIIGDYEKVDKVRQTYEKAKKVEKKESKDTDNDGLLDWQEVLYKTDFENPDTDGDGVLDGEEIKNGTSPTSTFTGLDDEKVEIIKENIENIESQMAKRLEKQKLQDKEIDLIKKIEVKSTLTAEEQKIVNDYNEDGILIKKDMDILGEVFLNNAYDIDAEEEGESIFMLFNNLLPYSYQKSVELLEEENNTEALNRLPKFKKMSENEIKSIEFKIKYYGIVSDALKAKESQMQSSGFFYYYQGLYESYSSLYKHTKNLLEFYKEGESDIEKALEEITEYTQVAIELSNIRASIDRMIDMRRLDISENTPASYFDLKL